MRLLSVPPDPEVVHALVAEDATYVSLDSDDPDLEQFTPWARSHDEPDGLLQTFTSVNRYFKNEAFDLTDVFGEGRSVAVIGSSTYRSAVLRQQVTSPIAILAEVTDCKVTLMRFMEDTSATARSFRSGGTWMVQANPRRCRHR